MSEAKSSDLILKSDFTDKIDKQDVCSDLCQPGNEIFYDVVKKRDEFQRQRPVKSSLTRTIRLPNSVAGLYEMIKDESLIRSFRMFSTVE